MKTAEHLQRAEGFLDLNMLSDAWTITEELVIEERGEPGVSELRLRILTAWENWELGECLARQLREGDAKQRETAAWFYLERARFYRKQSLLNIAWADYEKAIHTYAPISARYTDIDLEAIRRL